jgi:hypothetical protein
MTTWQLPPLILHPFSDQAGPGKLVQSSRASLMLQGLLPPGEASADDLDRVLLEGRFCEIRMLYYVGKDLIRWIDQCVEFANREPDLRVRDLKYQSFAALLVAHPPEPVREKLRKWGVADYRSIFSRALGLNAVFAQVPEQTTLAPDFIRHYYRYADQMFQLRQSATEFSELAPGEFDFQLYASGEYSRLLERQWEQ